MPSVEVDRQKPTRFIWEERVDAHDVLSAQMRKHRRVVDGEERMVRALAAPDPRQVTHAANKLVRARRRITRLAGFLAHEADGIDVFATPKQCAE